MAMMGAGAASARAMRRRRRSPPDTVVPPEPIVVSMPSGRVAIHSSRPARARRALASSRVREARATRRFSKMVVAKMCASSAVIVTWAAT